MKQPQRDLGERRPGGVTPVDVIVAEVVAIALIPRSRTTWWSK
jgi:hypothetical protein